NLAMPVEKSMEFGPSARRLLERLRPERARVMLVALLALASVSLSVIGPKILGHATDIIFSGVIGGQLPAGESVQDAALDARLHGNENFANMLLHMNVVPGEGVDFTALGHVLLFAM